MERGGADSGSNEHKEEKAEILEDGFLALIRRRTFTGDGGSNAGGVHKSPSVPNFASNSKRPPAGPSLLHQPSQSYVPHAGFEVSSLLNSEERLLLSTHYREKSAGAQSGGTINNNGSSSSLPSNDGAEKEDNTALTTFSVSPGTQATHKDEFVMSLHRRSMLEDLVTSVAHLVERRILGPGVRPGGKDSRGVHEAAKRLVRAHFRSLPSRYSLSVEPQDVIVHVKLMDDARKAGRPKTHLSFAGADLDGSNTGASLDGSNSGDKGPGGGTNGTTQGGGNVGGEDRSHAYVVVACKDSGDLLDTITKSLRSVSRRIIDADVMTSTDGIALDRFEVELSSDYCALDQTTLASLIEDAINSNREINSIREGIEGEEDGSGSESSYTPGPRPSSQNFGSSSSPRAGDSPSSTSAGQTSNRSDSTSPPLLPPGPPDKKASQSSARGEGHVEHIPFTKLELLETVGEGRYSRTHRALWDGQLVAVKSVDLSELERAQEQAAVLGEFERELEVVRRLSHPNVCTFHGVCVEPPRYCLVFEFVERGTLADMLKEERKGGKGGAGGAANKPSDWLELLRLATEVADGMRYLHSQGVLHRDLKSTNILISSDGSARIVDFGLSCFSARGMDLTAETGTYRWMAPEVIRHEPYSEAADVYSYGIVLWELVSRQQPFSGLTPIQAAFAVARQGLRPQLPPDVQPLLAGLIRRCWAANPAMRPSFNQICALLPGMKMSLLSDSLKSGATSSGNGTQQSTKSGEGVSRPVGTNTQSSAGNSQRGAVIGNQSNRVAVVHPPEAPPQMVGNIPPIISRST